VPKSRTSVAALHVRLPTPCSVTGRFVTWAASIVTPAASCRTKYQCNGLTKDPMVHDCLHGKLGRHTIVRETFASFASGHTLPAASCESSMVPVTFVHVAALGTVPVICAASIEPVTAVHVAALDTVPVI
jgi:hypothetical protein